MDLTRMTQKYKNELLEILVRKLDELDGEDFFGTEGWEHFFGVDED